MDPEVPGSSPGGGTISPADVRARFANSHARFAAHAAEALGLIFRSLDGDDAYLFEVSSGDGARRAVFSTGYGAPYALNSARAHTLARDKAFATIALTRAGVNTIPCGLFFTQERRVASRGPGRELADARIHARGARYPLFAKPNLGGRGEYAERIDDAAAFDDYLARVARDHESIVVSPFIEGDEYRVFVLEGRALFSYRKTPTQTGAAANRSRGGGAADFRDGAPAPLAEIARAAARALDLQLAGIDVFDVSPGRDLSDLVIIEANANPAIETLADVDRWDLIETIWRVNFDAALR